MPEKEAALVQSLELDGWGGMLALGYLGACSQGKGGERIGVSFKGLSWIV